MIFFKIFGLSLAFLLMLSGCQGNNSDVPKSDENSSSTPSLEVNATLDAVNLSFVNGDVLSVISSGEKKDIYIRAFNINGTLDTVGSISIQYPSKNIHDNIDVGTFNPTTAIIENGIAHFVYTAPADLQGRVDVDDNSSDFVFFSTNNPKVSSILHVKYNPSNDIVATPAVLDKLVLSESEINVTQSSQNRNFTLFAYTNQNTMNINAKILLKYENEAIGKDVGNLPASMNLVDGKVAFSYISPSNLLATANELSSTIVTLYDKDNPGVATSLKINFTPDKPTLRVESPTVILTKDGQAEQVTILAFDSNNQAFTNGTILVEYPTDITDGSVSGGIFTQNEVSIVNGKAIFNFTGPTPLNSISDQTFTFKYKEDPTAATVLKIQYSPDTEEKISVVLISDEYNVTLNSETVSISMNVFNGLMQPIESGNVKVSYPSDVLLGRDVGYFDSTDVPVVNGRATFLYTAPKDLENNTTSLKFKFYYETDFTNYDEFTINIDPAQNQIILTTYKIKSNLESNITMGLVSSKMLSFNIQDENGNVLEDSNITSITVKLLNPALGDLVSTNGNVSKTYSSDKNNISLRLDTQKISGIIPIQVFAKFKDANDDDQNITEVYNIVVLSGPPTAMSMIYNGTSYTDDGLYQENYTILVTDKYQNRVNTNPGLSLSMISGYAKDANDGRRLFSYPDINSSRQGDSPGSMDPINNIFEVAERNGYKPDFTKVDTDNDVLFTFGQGYTYNASGKWDIDINGVASNQLKLIDTFEANTTVDNIGYAIGHNYRQDVCKAGVEYVGQVFVDGNTSIIDKDGIAKVKINYPYYLGGKTIFISAEIVGKTSDDNLISKFSEVKKLTLRTTGFKETIANVSAGADSVTIYLPVMLKDAAEWYRNSNFGGQITASDNIEINPNNISYHGQLNSCGIPPSGSDEGVAFVKITDVNETQNKAGTITLKNIVTADEF